MQILPLDRIRSIHTIALELGLAQVRDALFSAMPGIKARMISAPTPTAQVLNDLNTLNSLPVQTGFSDSPLEIWLEAAIQLCAYDPRSGILGSALRDARLARQTGTTTPPAKAGPIRIFLSFAHEDKRFVELLRKHISPLVRKGIVVLRDKNTMAQSVDTPMETLIWQELSTNQLFLAFVSADYWVDDACAKEEEQALKLHSSAGLRIVPILTRPSNWKETSFRQLQALPNNREAISEFPDADGPMVLIVNAIHEMVKELAQAPAPVKTMTAPVYGEGNQWQAQHFLDRPSYAWEDPNAFRLFELLMKAYSQPREIESLGQFAGIDLAYWNRQGSARDLWISMLNIAANQGKARGLIEKVLGDSSKKAFHEEIKRCG